MHVHVHVHVCAGTQWSADTLAWPTAHALTQQAKLDALNLQHQLTEQVKRCPVKHQPLLTCRQWPANAMAGATAHALTQRAIVNALKHQLTEQVKRCPVKHQPLLTCRQRSANAMAGATAHELTQRAKVNLPNHQLTEQVKRCPVKHLAIHGIFVDLPIPRVHNGAVLAAHDEAAAVRDGVRHSQRRDLQIIGAGQQSS
jgi:hypothetical protein